MTETADMLEHRYLRYRAVTPTGMPVNASFSPEYEPYYFASARPTPDELAWLCAQARRVPDLTHDVHVLRRLIRRSKRMTFKRKKDAKLYARLFDYDWTLDL